MDIVGTSDANRYSQCNSLILNGDFGVATVNRECQGEQGIDLTFTFSGSGGYIYSRISLNQNMNLYLKRVMDAILFQVLIQNQVLLA